MSGPSTAIIGLGAMGMGMARNILAAGLPLKGYDLSGPARDRFAGLGGSACDSAAGAADGCDLLILMVVNAVQARAALFDTGAAAALAPGATVMLSSTVAPADARALAADLAATGVTLLDAPVSGGQVGAEAGTLTVMAAGAAAAFDRAAPVLEAIAKTVHRLGDTPGLGATYKTVHQLAAGVHLVAAAEVVALGTRAGCDPETLLSIISGAAGQSWMFDDRAPRMIMDDPPVTSTVEIFLKDLGLVLETGRDTATPLPLAAAAYQMLTAAGGLGHGQADDSAVIRAYQALTGTGPATTGKD
ncbi:NAD(P)-dependent oxidoreductase [Marimonas arenosa]|uniref:NAD(P)-binding domain-containing protein n=1 Tax=Marimonas arenosa TaxID=1795305 RepID=A0AAE3WBX6_9RHOB|nr:NAD(P)-binding domain-containing protein [Marimonas arenosa]MDQ2088870.1 NAD(P)-binding domain-containing protein [Marimonas arenosa]